MRKTQRKIITLQTVTHRQYWWGGFSIHHRILPTLDLQA